jgi:hypothetical protein
MTASGRSDPWGIDRIRHLFSPFVAASDGGDRFAVDCVLSTVDERNAIRVTSFSAVQATQLLRLYGSICMPVRLCS